MNKSKRSWNVSNKVDFMETLISWVVHVYRTLFLLLKVFNRWHNGKIVKLGLCWIPGLDITSARPDMITFCTVEYSVLILILCKSAIRRLFSSVV